MKQTKGQLCRETKPSPIYRQSQSCIAAIMLLKELCFGMNNFSFLWKKDLSQAVRWLMLAQITEFEIYSIYHVQCFKCHVWSLITKWNTYCMIRPKSQAWVAAFQKSYKTIKKSLSQRGDKPSITTFGSIFLKKRFNLIPACLESLGLMQRTYDGSLDMRISMSFARLALNWVAAWSDRHKRELVINYPVRVKVRWLGKDAGQ